MGGKSKCNYLTIHLKYRFCLIISQANKNFNLLDGRLQFEGGHALFTYSITYYAAFCSFWFSSILNSSLYWVSKIMIWTVNTMKFSASTQRPTLMDPAGQSKTGDPVRLEVKWREEDASQNTTQSIGIVPKYLTLNSDASTSTLHAHTHQHLPPPPPHTHTHRHTAHGDWP